MKSRIYYIERAKVLNIDITSHNVVFPTLGDAEKALPKGYKMATYGGDTFVIVENHHDFEKERYGEIGYVYTGFGA